jgi:hypothetical protein
MVNQDTFFTSSGTSPTQQRKQPAKRLFTGMVGREVATPPVSEVAPPVSEVTTPPVSEAPPIPKSNTPLKPTWLTQAHWDSLTHNDQVAYSRARWSEEHNAWIAFVPGIAQKEPRLKLQNGAERKRLQPAWPRKLWYERARKYLPSSAR